MVRQPGLLLVGHVTIRLIWCRSPAVVRAVWASWVACSGVRVGGVWRTVGGLLGMGRKCRLVRLWGGLAGWGVSQSGGWDMAGLAGLTVAPPAGSGGVSCGGCLSAFALAACVVVALAGGAAGDLVFVFGGEG